MKRAYIASIVILLYVLPLVSNAETIVGGMITTDTVWGIEGSPYIAEQSVLVMNGAKLTIEPGVEVRVNPALTLSVNDGMLVARGTEDSNICFTANHVPPDAGTNRWGYMALWDGAVDAAFDDNGSYTNGCILEYAVVEYAGGTLTDGAVNSHSSCPLVNFCTMTDNATSALRLSGSNIRITNCKMMRNSGIPISVTGTNAFVSGNLIYSNGCHQPFPTRSYGPIEITGSHACVKANVIYDNGGTSSDGVGIILTDASDSVCSSNSVLRSGSGIYVVTSSRTRVVKNEFSCNRYVGVSYGAARVSTGNSLDDNRVCSNKSTGVGIGSMTPGVAVTGNEICHNGGWGIGLHGDGSVLRNNRICDNVKHGVFTYYVDDCVLGGNDISRNGGAGFYAQETVANLTFSGDTVSHNATYGIYIPLADRIQLSAQEDAPTQIYGNQLYGIRNDSPFDFSTDPYAPGNIDARNVYWSTTNASEIQDMIYDFFDDAGKGIVFYEPYFLGWATNDVPINWLFDHGIGTNAIEVMDDPDEDGSPTWHEFFAGTNPTNEHSVFMITNIVNETSSNAVLRWLSVSNRTYSIRSCSDLSTGRWDDVRNGIPGHPPMNTETVQVEGAENRFYRVGVE